MSCQGRSSSVYPRFQLKLRGFATLSTLMSSMKQLSAEADPVKICSQNTFSLLDAYIQLPSLPKVSYLFLEILSDGRHSKDVYTVKFFPTSIIV